MDLYENSLQSLEWQSFLQIFSENCSSAPAKRLAFAIPIPELPQESEDLLRYTGEAKNFLTEDSIEQLSSLGDLDSCLERLQKEALLSGEECNHILNMLQIAKKIHKKFDPKKYTSLASLSKQIPDCFFLIEQIQKIIDPDGKVKDEASPTLKSLRQEEKILRTEASNKIQSILRNAYENDIAQDQYYDIREGRYVIPVRSEQRHRLQGFIYETSTSRATVYMEPVAIRELNDKIKQLVLFIEDEIYHILNELTKKLIPHKESLITIYELIITFDLHFARGKLAQAMEKMHGAEKPVFSQDIILDNLYHPLLAKIIPQKNLVTNSLHLDSQTSCLLISGPNTGGKTVILKALGLNALLAKTGFFVACKGTAKLPWYKNIFAQIGDEQSLTQSLSSFSAGILSLKKILQSIDHESLVLVDEILHSTDPEEAAALAKAIIEDFIAKEATSVITTHLSGLKSEFQQDKKLLHASMEFDRETMSPTYHIKLGIPGRSHALEIAEQLGLAENIISNAKHYLGEAHVKIEDVLANLEKREHELEAQKKEIALKQQEINFKFTEIAQAKEAILEKKQKFYKEARAELDQEKHEALEKLKNIVEEYKEKIFSLSQSAPLNTQQVATEAKQKQKELRDAFPSEKYQFTEKIITSEQPLQKNSSVFIKSLNKEGILLSDPHKKAKEAEVQIGIMKMRVAWEQIIPVEKKQSYTPLIFQQSTTLTPKELKLLGLRVDEALEKLEQYLDEVVRQGLPEVRIIHGTGTGALKTAIRKYLTNCSYPIKFHDAAQNEGGAGATIVVIE